MFAHDFFHALGGIHGKRRLTPCLYDFERQSEASRLPSPESHAIYMGPWDIISEHFVKKGEPSPGISSFTKIRLGWINPGQVLLVKPGETAMTFLTPLSQVGNKLAVKIPLKTGQYYLIENRQPIGFDRNLPDSGLLILKVDPELPEGSGTVKVMNANPNAPHFSQATLQVSPVKTLSFPCVNVGFIKHTPVADGEFRSRLPARPECASPHIRFLFVVQRFWIGLPSDPTSR